MTTKNLGLVSLGCMGWSEPLCERVPGLPRLKYPGGTCPRSDWPIRESPDPVCLCSLAITGHHGLLSSIPPPPPPLSCCRIIRRRGITEGVVKAVACGSYQTCARGLSMRVWREHGVEGKRRFVFPLSSTRCYCLVDVRPKQSGGRLTSEHCCSF